MEALIALFILALIIAAISNAFEETPEQDVQRISQEAQDTLDTLTAKHRSHVEQETKKYR